MTPFRSVGLFALARPRHCVLHRYSLRGWSTLESSSTNTQMRKYCRLTQIVRWVCHLVARRAALLSGVAVAAVLVQTGRAGYAADSQSYSHSATNEHPREEKIGVGVDGSLIQFYPHFESHMRSSLRAIVGKEVEGRVVIGLAKDGSGVGAALCALQALKQGVV